MVRIAAANRIGRLRIAQNGRPAATVVPARTRKATSVAVSNPRPNSTPSGYIFHGASIERAIGPKNRIMKPRELRCFSSSESSKRPWRIWMNRRTMPHRITRLSVAMRYKNPPETMVPTSVP